MGKNILVVDDSSAARRSVIDTLEAVGFGCAEVDGSRDALDTTKFANFDLVVLDVNMPEVNGFEVLTELRENPTTAHIPVVILSTEGQPHLFKRARLQGAKAWLVKPFDPGFLVDVVTKLTQ